MPSEAWCPTDAQNIMENEFQCRTLYIRTVTDSLENSKC